MIMNLWSNSRLFFTDKSYWWNNTLAGRVAQWGLMLYAIGIVLQKILQPYFPEPSFSIFVVAKIIEWLCAVGLWVFLVISIVWGIRDVRKNGCAVKRICVPACSVFFILMFLGVSVFWYLHRDALVDAAAAKVTPEQESRLDSGVRDESRPMEKRVFASRLLAQWKYLEDGSIQRQLMPDGTAKSFVPTADDLEFRWELLTTRAALEELDQSFIYSSVRLGLLLLVTLLLGFLTPIKKVAVVQSEKDPEADETIPPTA